MGDCPLELWIKELESLYQDIKGIFYRHNVIEGNRLFHEAMSERFCVTLSLEFQLSARAFDKVYPPF